MQPHLPGPWDLAIDLFRLLGLPLLVLAPLYLVAWGIAWLHTAELWFKGWQMIREQGGRSARYLMRQPVARQLMLYISTATIPASTYGFSRLWVGLDRSGLQISNRSDAHVIVSALAHYSSSGAAKAPMDWFWITLGGVAAILLDVLILGGTPIARVLTALLIVAAVLSGLTFLLSLILTCLAVALQQARVAVATSGQVVVDSGMAIFSGAFALSTYCFLHILWKKYDT